MKKWIVVIVVVTVAFANCFAGQDSEYGKTAPEFITPVETSIGGAAIIGSIVMVVRADMKRRMDKTDKASHARTAARSLALIGVSGITLGWISASYYERRLGLNVKIIF